MRGRPLLWILVGCSEPPAPITEPMIDGSVVSEIDASAPAALPAFCTDDRASSSAWLHYDDAGLLVYALDDDGNRLPDLGAAGYHAGADQPPVVAEAARIGPVDGDDTAHIQQALDELDGGALVLDPGVYEVAGTIRIRKSGVVLRGSGDGDDPAVDTILRATGDDPHQRSVVGIAGDGVDWHDALDGTQVEITTELVHVGEASFEVDHPERLAVGDRVIVKRPSTQAWIDALGGGGAQVAWTAGSMDVPFLRRVVAIDGARITLDAPLHDRLDRALAPSVVYAVDDAGLIRESGIEDLRVDIETAGGTDEDHAWNGFDVGGAEDSWVRGVTALHFGYAGVRVHDSDRITVLDSRALDPIGEVTGGRMYNFAADGFAQQVVFADCEARLARHGFVSNGANTVSGIVFLRGRSVQARNTSEGHRRWSTGLLYDGGTEEQPGTGRIVGLYNRGDWGTQHGWAAANSVLWGYDTGGRSACVQHPPTAQNWAIGVEGNTTGSGPFPGTIGLVEPIDGALAPASLYEAQVCDRLRRGP